MLALFDVLCCASLLLNSTHVHPAPWFNKKMSSYQYRKSHCGDKTILWPSYLHNGIYYTNKTTSLYWIRALATSCAFPWVSDHLTMMTSWNGNIFRVIGQWRGALISSLICVWINGWVNNREAGDMRRYRAHYDVSVMWNVWAHQSCHLWANYRIQWERLSCQQ